MPQSKSYELAHQGSKISSTALQIIPQVKETRNQIIVHQRVGTVAFSQHLTQEIDGLANAAGVDETLSEMAIGHRGRAERGIGNDMAIDLDRHVNVPLITVGVD
ncbi:hypothetical protein Ahy_A02g006241 isoform E [Arachis hypogaea]|uniref:Uncharacterized protein n=1 Tax=Arachis hypogaea TaxID=3818 RepID=A0A445E9R0_ARAHY|nr:hypothetical protein Ahy_A02g006241 isoform E [Arachis hypogaea]